MKNILITGVSSGIGFHLVKTFSNLPGYNIIGFSRNKNKLKQLKSSMEASKGSNVYLEAIDINKLTAKNVQQIFTKHKIKKLDVLINNAGLLINKPFLKLKPADWQSIYSTNVFSQISLIQHCHKYLKKSKDGHIVNISSLGGIPMTDKFPGLSAYSSSKAAIAVFTEVLAKEFQKDKIACNCLALGAVQTPMLSKAFPGYKAEVEPDEMAKFIADFSLNGHKTINGKILPIAKPGI